MEKVGPYDPYWKAREAKLLMHNCRDGPKGIRTKFGVYLFKEVLS